MKLNSFHVRSTALAALLSLPLAAGMAGAQQAQDSSQQPVQNPAEQQQNAGQNVGQSGQSSSPSQSGTGQSQDATAQSAGETGPSASPQSSPQPSGTPQPDGLVATVGDAEIRSSDLMMVIGQLPPPLQSQPPQMLVSLALQQLVLRELILKEARAQNLAEDPEVQALVNSSAQTAEEDAMLKVWLDREMASAVTDDAVQQVYQGLGSTAQGGLPPLDQLRPQIQQHLRQQAMQDIQSRLQQNAEIVLYDATGNPIAQPQGSGSGQEGSGSTEATQSGEAPQQGSGASQSQQSQDTGQQGSGSTGSQQGQGGQPQDGASQGSSDGSAQNN